VRQVGQLPRIIAGCTVYKTLNQNCIVFITFCKTIQHKIYKNPMFLTPCTFLQSIYQSTNALNKIQMNKIHDK